VDKLACRLSKDPKEKVGLHSCKSQLPPDLKGKSNSRIPYFASHFSDCTDNCEISILSIIDPIFTNYSQHIHIANVYKKKAGSEAGLLQLWLNN
jgi:hypothetical protein